MTYPTPPGTPGPGQYPSYPQQPGQPGQPPYGQIPQQPGQPYPGQAPYPGQGQGQAYPGQAYPGQPGPQYPGGGYGYPGRDPYAYGMQQRPPYASWGARVGATLIDGLIGLIPAVVMFIGLVMTLAATVDTHCTSYEASQGLCTRSTGGSAGPGLALVFVGAIASVALSLWMLYKQGRTGQTIGKKAMGISVLRERDGMPQGFGMAFARSLCHIADSFFYLGYLWPLWDEKKQTFADKIVSTVVVRVK
ncbi:hypothetical protein CTZ27_21250 [Streptomyces griseocarneus]|nr:hypothetical protein CTZ27_21250 [Streptomyces griseocarneus]